MNFPYMEEMSVPYVHVIYILIDNNEYLRKYTALNRNSEKDVNTLTQVL